MIKLLNKVIQAILLFQGIDTSHLFTGDSLSYHNGRMFSTKDHDHDGWPENCAARYHGAWWYNACHHCNLNGLYLNGSHSSIGHGVIWRHWMGLNYSLKFTEMKLARNYQNWMTNFYCIKDTPRVLTSHVSSVVFILGHRSRCWSNIKTTLRQCLSFAWLLCNFKLYIYIFTIVKQAKQYIIY